MNKTILLVALLSLFSFRLYSQIRVSSSFEESIKKNYPNLHYFYNEGTATHDYSNNWDLDGDGKLDSLTFKGNDAVVLSFMPIVKSSILGKIFEFPSISCDFPYLESIIFLRASDPASNFPKLVVYDFTNDGILDVYLKVSLNDTGETMPIIITFNKGEFKIEKYSSTKKVMIPRIKRIKRKLKR